MRKVAVLGVLALVVLGAVLLFISRVGGAGYQEVITLKGEGVEVTLLSRDGRIKSGGNSIKVVVKPPRKLREFYFYMPPMPGMDEMRSVAKLKEVEPGVYEGTVNISMDGPWQIRAVFEDVMVTKDVFVPLSKTEMATDHGHTPAGAHAGHIMIPKDKLQLIGVLTEPVKRRKLVKVFSTVGYIEYDRSKIYDITVRADAWVEETFGRFEGEYVKKGAPLMRVLSPDIQVALEELRLAEEKGDQELIRKAREKLEYLKIKEIVRSPVNGVIIEKKVFEGGYVREGQTAYRIADIGNVWIVAELPLNLAGYVSTGSRVKVIPEEYPQTEITGRVDYIFPEADPLAKTVKVRIQAENVGLRLKPRALADVIFEVPIGEVLAVPETAVVDTGKRTLVFVEVDQGMFAPRMVKLGKKAEGYYEVKHGLKEGEKVVVKGTFLIDSEAQIRGVYGTGSSGHQHH
ncbi:MAG: efflux RND transporter periplasmic adaptor subunit [Aquificota bacterium]|nr:efflux RND transporter periplasmic adaptor subunit [Aquificota bacterium]